jgi:hypothetical protein
MVQVGFLPPGMPLHLVILPLHPMIHPPGWARQMPGGPQQVGLGGHVLMWQMPGGCPQVGLGGHVVMWKMPAGSPQVGIVGMPAWAPLVLTGCQEG